MISRVCHAATCSVPLVALQAIVRSVCRCLSGFTGHGSKMVLKYFSIIAVAGVGLMYWHGIQSEKAVETLVKVADRVEADCR